MSEDESPCGAMTAAQTDAQEAEKRRRLRDYVNAQMGAAKPPLSRSALAKRAGIDRDTLANWLDGRSWPHASRRAAAETALGLEPGTFDAVYRGQSPDGNVIRTGGIADPHSQLSQMVVTFDASALSGLSVTEREEVEAAAKAAALQRIREIRGQ